VRQLALALVVLASCGAKAHAPVDHQVVIRGMQFVPARVEVEAGDSVTWTNEDFMPHTASLPGIFDSMAIAPKQRWSYVVAQRGELAYVCAYHPTMHGTIVAR